MQDTFQKNKKELIKQTALSMFADFGYEPSSVSKIAKQAGVSKSLLYNYFESKEELLKDIMAEGLDLFLSSYHIQSEKKFTDEDMINFINRTFETLKANAPYLKLYFSIIMQKNVIEIVQEKMTKIMMPFFELLTIYFQEKNLEKPSNYAILLGATLDGISINYLAQPEIYPIEDMKELLIKQFVYQK